MEIQQPHQQRGQGADRWPGLAGSRSPAVAGKCFLSSSQRSLIIIYPPQAAWRPAREQHGAGDRAQPGSQEAYIWD